MGVQVVNAQDHEGQQEGDFKTRKVQEFLQIHAFLNFVKSLPNPSPKNNRIECGMRNAEFGVRNKKNERFIEESAEGAENKKKE